MINKKIFKVFLLIIFTGLITSCINNQSMKPEDFKDQKPRLIIEEYLSGNVKAWGAYKNYKQNQKIVSLAKKVQKQSNKYKKQLSKCKNRLTTRKYIIF